MGSRITELKLREWMGKLGPRLIHLSTAICRDRHHAEEIVQEAFVKLWHKPPDAGEVAYAAWLRRVVTNLSINALKRTRRPAALPAHANDPGLRSRERPEILGLFTRHDLVVAYSRHFESADQERADGPPRIEPF